MNLEFLNGLDLYTLRSVARRAGVSDVLEKRRKQLIEEILASEWNAAHPDLPPLDDDPPEN